MAITLGIISAVMANEQAEANAEMQANQMAYNKRLEEREAARIEAENSERARRQRITAEYNLSAARAALGKSGAALASGSPLAILGRTAANEEMAIQDSLYSGYNQAQQHRNQAEMYQYQANVARAQAPSGMAKFLNITNGAISGLNSNISIANSMLNMGSNIKKGLF